jgi:CheY-like chemotaxis protein/HPt (histidine-containing phosphotransfer) domain-containing protein
MVKVLVVEDEDTTRLMLERQLSWAGYRVRATASADEATGVLDGIFEPDVVVTDMFMPGGSGLSLASAVRHDPLHTDLPVIFLSGRALPGDVAAGTALNATYLAKPVSGHDLTEAIDAALEQLTTRRDEAVREHAGTLWDTEDDAERQLYARLLTGFVASAPDLLAEVAEALRAEAALEVEAAAHKLGGAAATLGAGPLAGLCRSLEDAARTKQLLTPALVVSALQRELELTCTVFTELAAELSA